jgi:hypothetical protein
VVPTAGASAEVPVKPPRDLPCPALASIACRTIDREGGLLGDRLRGVGYPDLAKLGVADDREGILQLAG